MHPYTRTHKYKQLLHTPITSHHLQTHLVFLLAPKQGYTVKVDNGWLEVIDIFPDPSGKQYYLTLPDTTDAKNVQIYAVSVSTSKATKLTDKACDVISISKVITKPEDTKSSILYYMSTEVGKPGERHLMTLETQNDIKTGQWRVQNNRPFVVSAQRSKNRNMTNFSEDPECLFNRFAISAGKGSYAIQQCLGPNVPYSKLIDTKTGEQIIQWSNNGALEDLLKDKLVPLIKTITITTPQNNSKLKLYFNMYI